MRYLLLAFCGCLAGTTFVSAAVIAATCGHDVHGAPTIEVTDLGEGSSIMHYFSPATLIMDDPKDPRHRAFGECRGQAVLTDGQQSSRTVLLAVNTLPAVGDFLGLDPSGDGGAFGGTQALVVLCRDNGSTKVNGLSNSALNIAWLASNRGWPGNAAHLDLAGRHLETGWLTPVA